jgi:5-methylcytosine-specific restriction enzyme B
MSTVRDRALKRLRVAFEYLARHDGKVSKDEVVAYAGQEVPPVDEDLEEVPSGGARWLVHLHWYTVDPTKAGWLLKDGRGGWFITEAGRQALDRYQDPESFYGEANRLYREWRDQHAVKPQRRAWLIKGSSVRGTNVVREWLEGGWVSLSASQLREISAEISAGSLRAAVKEDYRNLQPHDLSAKVEEIDSFVHVMSGGDVVITTSDKQLWLGDVTGDWTWRHSEGERTNLRRTVEWRNVDTPIALIDLPQTLQARLASSGPLIDLTSELDVIDDLTVPDPVPGPAHEHLDEPSVALASSLLIDHGWLTNVRDLLHERKQIILYGPPGTGKTFVARRLATDLVGLEQVRLVQFHPAYSYEDFFEGYRPHSTGDGTIGFELQPGPLRRLVTEATEQRDLAFVLIIDEINRANLAKVFGELYFLLEYRDQAVELMYSNETFTLPPNIYLIGTMNTADRSIALVDSAMRRRFAFIALDPSEEPTRGLLRRWSAGNGLPSTAADLVDALNDRVGDPDFQVGPSYFMRSVSADAFSRERLQRIWDADILPLLKEHFYGQWSSKASQLTLESLLEGAEPSNQMDTAEVRTSGTAAALKAWETRRANAGRSQDPPSG